MSEEKRALYCGIDDLGALDSQFETISFILILNISNVWNEMKIYEMSK